MSREDKYNHSLTLEIDLVDLWLESSTEQGATDGAIEALHTDLGTLVDELQEDMVYRDIWDHLKKRVKRIERVEVYSCCTGGWICVRGHALFVKALEILQAPVYVTKTGTSRLVVPTQTNEKEMLTIKRPKDPESPFNKVINEIAIPPEPKEEVIWTSNAVIAHGTYTPDLTPHMSPNPGDSLPAYPICPPSPPYEIVPPVYQSSLDPCTGWCINPQDPRFYTQCFYNTLPHPPPPPTPEEVRHHLVLLDNFHPTTTAWDVENLVWLSANKCQLRDPRIRIVYGCMVLTRTKCDAGKLRTALDGQLLNGVRIQAQEGPQQPRWCPNLYDYY
ncbi:hypothetical protein F5Y01DRAFT_320019 [Xylaria sp. FL0043]|nr:hypothetical protein F5Y01DRAFT_320019 [Xylaria sp. FL0043]